MAVKNAIGKDLKVITIKAISTGINHGDS